jgi:hypothetical protein
MDEDNVRPEALLQDVEGLLSPSHGVADDARASAIGEKLVKERGCCRRIVVDADKPNRRPACGDLNGYVSEGAVVPRDPWIRIGSISLLATAVATACGIGGDILVSLLGWQRG